MNDVNVILADAPELGRVRLCECNSIHMSIGPVTINLTPKAFTETAAMISTAADQLAAITGSTPEQCNPLKLQNRFTH